MLTISQLAAYAGVSVRTVRHYHDRGLLPEPERDASGYRRYGGQAVVDLVRIRTLAAAGVPLARLPALLSADDASFTATLAETDRELARRIRRLQQHRRDLAQLAEPEQLCLPDGAVAVMDRLREIGLGDQLLAAYRDGLVLLDAVQPDGLAEQVEWLGRWLEDPTFVDLLLRCEAAVDWAPDDPRLADLADLTADLTRRLDAEDDATVLDSDDLIRAFNRDLSPAWAALNDLVEQRLAQAPTSSS